MMGIFRITGDTEISNEHFHIFQLAKDKNGIIAGQTYDTIDSEDLEPMWDKGHIHLIVAEDITAETEAHTHEIMVFKGAENLLDKQKEDENSTQDLAPIEVEQTKVITEKEEIKETEVVREREGEEMIKKRPVFMDKDIIDAILALRN
jgi:hypothetical protein